MSQQLGLVDTVNGNEQTNPIACEGYSLSSLPDALLARIAKATDPEARRQLRLTNTALRALTDSCATSLTVTPYNVGYLSARGRLPDFVPELRKVELVLHDCTAPADVISKLPQLGTQHLLRLESLTLDLAHDHYLPSSSVALLAAAIPPSTTQLILNHPLGCDKASPPVMATRPRLPPPSLPQPSFSAHAQRPATATAPPSAPSATTSEQHGGQALGAVRHLPEEAPEQHDADPHSAQRAPAPAPAAATAAAVQDLHQLNLPMLHYLLALCPQIREVHLDGGCWVRRRQHLQALADLVTVRHQPCDDAPSIAPAIAADEAERSEAAAAAVEGCRGAHNGGGGGSGNRVVVASLRNLFLEAPYGYQGLPEALASLHGLRTLHVQLVPIGRTVAQGPDRVRAEPGGVNDILERAEQAAAAADAAFMSLASENLLMGLVLAGGPGGPLVGLTRLVVCEFQGSTISLLEALTSLSRLAHLGLSGLDDAPYITNTHLELLARLPSLRHLAVDRLDISHQYHHHHHQPAWRDQQYQTQAPPPPPPQQQQQAATAGAGAASTSGDVGGPQDAAFDGYFAFCSPSFGAQPGLGGSMGAGLSPGLGQGGGEPDRDALLPRLTGLEVAIVAHSEPRLPRVFPAVQHLELRWLWEQAMRKVAGWTRLTCLSLSNLDVCLDWGLLRTLTGLTQLQLCRGSSYHQLAELLYLTRALSRLEVLRLAGWHCRGRPEADCWGGGGGGGRGLRQRGGGPGLPLPGRGGGAAAGSTMGLDGGDDGCGDGGGHGVGRCTADGCTADGAAGLAGGVAGLALHDAAADRDGGGGGGGGVCVRGVGGGGGGGGGGGAAAGDGRHWDTAAARGGNAFHGGTCALPYTAAAASSPSSSSLAAAVAALDPDLHRAWARIRAAPNAAAAAGAALSLLRALPRLRSLELSDCGNPLLLALASRGLLEDGGPLEGVRQLQLVSLVDAMAADVEAVVAALPGLRRLVVVGCWPVDGEALLRMGLLAKRGVDVVWRR